jgi:protein-L-isoaspartate(D-aspartate) O-methyltransferase
MTEVIKPEKDFRVLEIGTGSGYQAAVLAEIVDSVFTIEIVEDLGKEAKKRLTELGYSNVVARTGDGYQGWKEKGPFDAIVVTAAAEQIPLPLVEQLKEGGRMVIPLGEAYMTQRLVLVEKVNGKTKTKDLMLVRFVPFTRPDDR